MSELETLIQLLYEKGVLEWGEVDSAMAAREKAAKAEEVAWEEYKEQQRQEKYNRFNKGISK